MLVAKTAVDPIVNDGQMECHTFMVCMRESQSEERFSKTAFSSLSNSENQFPAQVSLSPKRLRIVEIYERAIKDQNGAKFLADAAVLAASRN